MKYLLSFLVIVGLIAGGGYWYYDYIQQKRLQPKYEIVTISETTVQAELANTPEKHIQGLSGRQSLGTDEGMLFVYDTLRLPGFWMKDMLFDIDIIWIRDEEIIDIDENVPAPDSEQTELEIYRPSKAINKVLEVNAGWVEEHGVEVGQYIKTSDKP